MTGVMLMIGFIQRFLGLIESGNDTVEEVEVKMHKEWICRGCEETFLYPSIRCPLCESVDFDEISRPFA